MTRSPWKVPYISNIFFSNYYLTNSEIPLWNRHSIIPYSLLNKIFFVYNGIWFIKLEVTIDFIGFKLGEFGFTKRINKIHTKSAVKQVVKAKAKRVAKAKRAEKAAAKAAVELSA